MRDSMIEPDIALVHVQVARLADIAAGQTLVFEDKQVRVSSVMRFFDETCPSLYHKAFRCKVLSITSDSPLKRSYYDVCVPYEPYSLSAFEKQPKPGDPLYQNHTCLLFNDSVRVEGQPFVPLVHQRYVTGKNKIPRNAMICYVLAVCGPMSKKECMKRVYRIFGLSTTLVYHNQYFSSPGLNASFFKFVKGVDYVELTHEGWVKGSSIIALLGAEPAKASADFVL